MSTNAPTPIEEDRPCPACGYSLRGLMGSACPECGQALDREAIMHGRQPQPPGPGDVVVRAVILTVLAILLYIPGSLLAWLILSKLAAGLLSASLAETLVPSAVVIGWVVVALVCAQRNARELTREHTQSLSDKSLWSQSKLMWALLTPQMIVCIAFFGWISYMQLR